MSKCILWTGAKQSKGYGNVSVSGKNVLAHRLAFMLANPFTDIAGLMVLHLCDVRLCVNPKHLFSGTAQENTDDMMKKGRWVKPRYHRGPDHHNAKLSWRQVREIRRQYRFGVRGSGSIKLAAKYGVSKPVILGIVRGELYKEVSHGARSRKMV